MITFVLVQILGIFTLIISIIALQQRKKENFLLLHIFSNSIFVLQYFLANKFAGATILIIIIIREAVFLYYKKKNLKSSIVIMVVFQILVLVSTYFTWQNIMSIIPLITTIVATWGTWQDNMKYTRRTILFAQACWIVYDFTAGMYTGMITDSFNTASTIIAIWRYDRKTT